MRRITARAPVWVAMACVAASLACAPGAAAQGSDFDQYVPQVPEAEGDAPVRDKKEQSTDPSGGGGGVADDATIPPTVAEDLAAEGTTGEEAAAAAEATDPRKVNSNNGSEAKVKPPGLGGESAPTAVAGTAASGSDEGMGIILPLLLAATLVAAIAYAIAVRRRRSQ